MLAGFVLAPVGHGGYVEKTNFQLVTKTRIHADLLLRLKRKLSVR